MRILDMRLKFASCALFGVAMGVPAGAASAQDSSAPAESAPAPDAASADIIVTAQKRSERISDVPISIAAIDGDTLARQGIVSTADLAKVVPGFTYQRSTFGVPTFTIRGIGLYDVSVGNSPTVSVYVDQAPLPYLVMTPGVALDVERVEVLKGPQGLLFGQNSTGGAINYIAAKPTSTPQMGFDLSYGRFNQVDTQAFVSGPITDTLRVRVAARHEYMGPWQVSETRPKDRLGRRDFATGRVLLDWDASDRLSFSLNINGWQDRSDSQAAQFVRVAVNRPVAEGGYTEATDAIGNRPPAPRDARAADWDPGLDYGSDSRQYQIALRGDYELSDAVDLTSITSYSNLDYFIRQDSDGVDFNDYRLAVRADIRDFYQELRAAIALGGANVTLGATYQNDSTYENHRGDFIGSNSGVGPLRFSGFNEIAGQEIETVAGFVSGDLRLSRTITLQAGVRYTTQTRDFAGCLSDAGDGRLAAAIGLIPVLSGGAYDPAAPGSCVTYNSLTDFGRPDIVTLDLDEDNLSWRAGLNWKPSRDTLVYGNVTRGYKAGSFAPLAAIFVSQLDPVVQEQVTAFEAGLKQQFADNRYSVTAAAFYYEYRDKQILGTTNLGVFKNLPKLVNVPKSNVRGVEVNLTARPAQGLTLTAGGTYIRSRVSESFFTPDPFGQSIDIRGQAFPNTPEWQFTGNAEYSVPIGSSLEASIGGDASYRSSSNAAFGENAFFALPSYTLVGLRAGIGSPDQRWRVELWGRNVFDTFYWTGTTTYGDTVSRFTGLPATYGVTLRSRF